MFVLGLTGSIGMGKTTAADAFRRLGVPVHDSDAAVHRLLRPDGKAFREVAEHFPDCITDGHVDRQALGAQVFDNDKALKTLEGILHPLVQEAEKEFLRNCERRRERMVVLDIPLLFETGAESRCDAVAVVTAPGFIQRQRVLSRPGMTPEKLVAILSRQMPDHEKCRLADFVIQTSQGRAFALRQIQEIVRLFQDRGMD